MYTYVHMTMTVSITDFRNNLFEYADLVDRQGYEFEVEKEGKKMLKISKAVDDSKERSKRVARALRAAAGKFPEFEYDREFFRGKGEVKWMKNLERRVKW